MKYVLDGASLSALEREHRMQETSMSIRLGQVQDWPNHARLANWSAVSLAKQRGVSVRTLEQRFLKTLGKPQRPGLADNAKQTPSPSPPNGFPVKDKLAWIENRCSETPRKLANPPFRIALMDTDTSVYAAVKEVCNHENWMLDFYCDSRHALLNIPFAPPGLVLMDIRMSDLFGIDCIKRFKCHAPSLPIVMLTACADFENILFSLMAGANGYLLKPVSFDQLKDTISRAIRGKAALCEEAQAVLLSCLRTAFSSASTKALSRRELQIMACLIQGLADKEISERLHIAPNTVHVYLVRLFRHLGVHSRNEAIQKYFYDCIGTSCCHCRLPIPDRALPPGPSNPKMP